jgi:hypothetical protein
MNLGEIGSRSITDRLRRGVSDRLAHTQRFEDLLLHEDSIGSPAAASTAALTMIQP